MSTQTIGKPTEAADLRAVAVADAMHHGVVTCRPEASLLAVARMMAAHRVHCIVVFRPADGDEDDPFVWGLVSDLDLVGAVEGDVHERTAGGTAATPVVTVSPHETLARAAQLMAEYGTAHLVVVEAGSSRPSGILSTLDVARAIAD